VVLSLAATNSQLGLLLHAGVMITALKLSAPVSTCDRAMKAAALKTGRLRSTHEPRGGHLKPAKAREPYDNEVVKPGLRRSPEPLLRSASFR